VSPTQSTAQTLVIDRDHQGQPLYGIGGVSGGGATSRLLIDYVEPQRSQILDYLFKPYFGASYHILKVEIGGDSQSTDGTESSHMHSADDLDYNRGYEWWLMEQAKMRNPNIKLYGLPWAFPGWVGNGSGSPYTYPQQTAEYITKWVAGAEQKGLHIDYIGIWNERDSDATYVKTLRKMLDKAGFSKTTIVAADGGSDICNDLHADADYASAVGIIGLHYPSDYSNYDNCHSLNKPLWSSEESSSYDDLNGAACWGRVITSHWVLSQMTSSIMWNLVGAYFEGTNWYASSTLTAVQPWSGYYEISPVIWASAHVTQFTQPGWIYLQNNRGSGELLRGGFYTTLVDPANTDFSLVIVKISEDHAACTRPSLPHFNVSAETVVFELGRSMGKVTSLAYWVSNFQDIKADQFVRQDDLVVNADGTFKVHIPVGAMITLSTIKHGPQKGSFDNMPSSEPMVPLPIVDTFDSYEESSEAQWWSDQVGIFEVHAIDSSNKVMRQMVPEAPVAWGGGGENGPLTLNGMREWQDISIKTVFRVPADSTGLVAGCIGTRSDQIGSNGIFFCVYTAGNWSLSTSSAQIKTGVPSPDAIISTGRLPSSMTRGDWHSISLLAVDSIAVAAFDGHTVISGQAIRNLDTGFAMFGTNAWIPIEFDAVSITSAGPNWKPPSSPCSAATPGTQLYTRNCSTNGFTASDQGFYILADWTIQHIASGLCAQTSSVSADATVSLQTCNSNQPLQQFKNDYTRIRDTTVSIYLSSNPNMKLTGTLNGPVGLNQNSAKWNSWAYFPSSNQLRNQYVASTDLGYPQCLSTCRP